MIRSHWSTKLRRCAMDKTVVSTACVEITLSRRSAESLSRAAVASSNTRILGCRTRARAAVSSCISPKDRSDAKSSLLKAMELVSFWRPHAVRVVKTAASVVLSPPMFALSDPLKITGSCGTMPMRLLKQSSLNEAMSMPSMTTDPPLPGATPAIGPSLNSKFMSVDLPLPVGPTTPTFSPPRMSAQKPRRARGEWGAYRNETSWKEIAPQVGHVEGAVSPSEPSACGLEMKSSMRLYLLTVSTAVSYVRCSS
mmetsp:Transcript_62431/g.182466  ORF Transcript_62431/g.182466 Transcript_62431/m.182466 type:complete len:253 (-) Transcript_62431:2272-3030(-)